MKPSVFALVWAFVFLALTAAFALLHSVPPMMVSACASVALCIVASYHALKGR